MKSEIATIILIIGVSVMVFIAASSLYDDAGFAYDCSTIDNEGNVEWLEHCKQSNVVTKFGTVLGITGIFTMALIACIVCIIIKIQQ